MTRILDNGVMVLNLIDTNSIS